MVPMSWIHSNLVFYPGCGIETALVSLTDDHWRHVDQCESVLLLLVDLSSVLTSASNPPMAKRSWGGGGAGGINPLVLCSNISVFALYSVEERDSVEEI